MGFLDNIKSVFGQKTKVYNDNSIHLVNAQISLKEANEFLTKFLDNTRDFHPAKRHEQLYAENIKGKLTLVKAWLNQGLVFLDDKLNNSLNTASNIKSADHLSKLLTTWIQVIKIEEKVQQQIQPQTNRTEVVTTYANWEEPSAPMDEPMENKLKDIVGILRYEMWSSDRAKRGFPVPQNKEALFSLLDNTVVKFRESKEHLNNYNISNSIDSL